MTILLQRLWNNPIPTPRQGLAILLLILAVVGGFSGLTSYAQPFWYDEVITYIVARLPSADIWGALEASADTHPPTYHLITGWIGQFFPDVHLGYRIPSILGVLVALTCTYFAIAYRLDRLSALTGVAFLLCTALVEYASIARPYALMVGWIALAILAWQRIDQSRLYSVAMGLALAGALTAHYFSVFVWPAFGLAELTVWIETRRLRWDAWIALILATSPLVLFARILMNLHATYGDNFWAQSNFTKILAVPSYLFNTLTFWGFSMTIVAIILLLYWNFTRNKTTGGGTVRWSITPEAVLICMLLLLPVIVITAGKITGNGMADRYMLPAVLGGALAVGYIASKLPPAIRVILFLAMFLNYSLIAAQSLKNSYVDGSLLGARAAATTEVADIFDQYQDSGLPIVISHGLDYLPMAFYAPSDAGQQLYNLTDPEAAVQYLGTASLDIALIILKNYYPLQVEDYSAFASKCPEFILVTTPGGRFEYWPTKLVADGHSLTLLSIQGGKLIYRVNLNQ